MVKFLTYLYYRALGYYEIDFQAATPLQLCIPMNLATCIVILLRILAWKEVHLHPSAQLAIAGFFIFGGLALFCLVFIFIYMQVMKKSIAAKIEEFSQETPEERRKNGK